MREINTSIITNKIAELCIKANKILPDDLSCCISCAKKCESNLLAKEILLQMENNISSAKELDIPVCQDTGMAVIFIEVGQDVHLAGELLEDAINNGVKQGYEQGLLRKSVVKDPINRVNTNDNTPAIIHTKIVKGDKVKITVAPKGFGSENMSKIFMLTPAADRNTVIDKVVSAVKEAGGNPCPPVVVGVGIGGDFEYSAILAKKALARPISEHNSNEFYKKLEEDILNKLNQLNIGPQGFGGNTTALAVNIETFATHIAGLPLAVNIGCHVTRHITAII